MARYDLGIDVVRAQKNGKWGGRLRLFPPHRHRTPDRVPPLALVSETHLFFQQYPQRWRRRPHPLLVLFSPVCSPFYPTTSRSPCPHPYHPPRAQAASDRENAGSETIDSRSEPTLQIVLPSMTTTHAHSACDGHKRLDGDLLPLVDLNARLVCARNLDAPAHVLTTADPKSNGIIATDARNTTRPSVVLSLSSTIPGMICRTGRRATSSQHCSHRDPLNK